MVQVSDLVQHSSQSKLGRKCFRVLQAFGLGIADAEGERWEELAVGGLEESLQGSGHQEAGLYTLLAPAFPKYLLIELYQRNPGFILCSRCIGPQELWCLTSTCPVHRRGEA